MLIKIQFLYRYKKIIRQLNVFVLFIVKKNCFSFYLLNFYFISFCLFKNRFWLLFVSFNIVELFVVVSVGGGGGGGGEKTADERD